MECLKYSERLLNPSNKSYGVGTQDIASEKTQRRKYRILEGKMLNAEKRSRTCGGDVRIQNGVRIISLNCVKSQ